MNTKKCGRCKEEKSIDDFYRSKTTKDGLKCYCKECIKQDNKKRESHYNELRKKYRETHKEEMRENKRKYYQNNKVTINAQNMKWAQTLKGRFSTYKNHAKLRNIEFNLTEEEFNTFWKIPCYYCGSKINTIGLDRINSNGNYDINNVVPCCSICNKMKMDLNVDIFMQQIKKIYENRIKYD